MTPTLAYYTYKAAFLALLLAMQAKNAAGANAANTVKIFSKLFYTINTQELLQTRSKPSRQSIMGRSGSHHIENKTRTKLQNKSRAKRVKKTIENMKQFRLEVR